MNKAYDIIFSIGQDCGCAFYMQRYNLRSYAGPMDWITGARLDYRLELILNDFKGFLEKKNLKPLDLDNHDSNKKYDLFQCQKSRFRFFHDFKVDIPFDMAFKEVKSKYERRIKRFYKKVKSSEKVLLVWFSRYETYDDSMEKTFCEKIMQKFGKEIDFLFIEHDATKEKDELEKIEISKNITKYVINAAVLNGTDNETLGNATLCDKIFSKYKLIEKKDTIRNAIFRKIIKTISLVAIFKEKRKRFRNYLMELTNTYQ